MPSNGSKFIYSSQETINLDAHQWNMEESISQNYIPHRVGCIILHNKSMNHKNEKGSYTNAVNESRLLGIKIFKGIHKINGRLQQTTSQIWRMTYKYCKFKSWPSWGTSWPERFALPRSLSADKTKALESILSPGKI